MPTKDNNTESQEMQLTRSMPYKMTAAEAKGIAAKNMPAYFAGQKLFNPAVVSGYRTFLQNPTNNYNISALTRGCSDLKPLAASLNKLIHEENKNNVGPLISTAVANRFSLEISRALETNKVSYSWILMIYLRYAAAISQISADERDLFMHLIHANVFIGLTEDKAWDDHLSSILNIATTDGLSFGLSFHTDNIDFSIFDFVTNELRTEFNKYGSELIYPVAGFSKFGISFMLDCFLNHVSLVGLPAKNNLDGRFPAHGARLSRASFIIHDTLHDSLDFRFESLTKRIVTKVDAFVGEGGDAKSFVRFYTPIVVRQHHALMSCLKSIHHLFLTHLLPHCGKSEFQKAMCGFFFATHEYPGFYKDLLNGNDLINVIRILSNHTVFALHSEDTWESPIDPLKTSPLDGKSLLAPNDAELKIALIKHFYPKLFNSNSFHLPPTVYDRINKLELSHEEYKRAIAAEKRKMIRSARVEQSPRFIDVIFELRNGSTIKFSEPTLYHKWTNLDDSLGLLKMAGVKITKPDLSGLSAEESRKAALKLLTQARDEIVKTVRMFSKHAEFYANMPDAEGVTLAQRYFSFKFSLDSKVAKAMDQALQPNTSCRVKPKM